MLLTQYLVSGQVEICENELILNKILCGVPLETKINTKLKISNKEKEECQGLLKAVLEHWKPMNGVSVEVLMETFLQRPGKLDISDPDSLTLWVGEKAVDILTVQLPWGIGYIKTTWMENYLACNWS